MLCTCMPQPRGRGLGLGLRLRLGLGLASSRALVSARVLNTLVKEVDPFHINAVLDSSTGWLHRSSCTCDMYTVKYDKYYDTIRS